MVLLGDALTMAKFRRWPAPGLIFHSDRHSQYASAPVHDWLADNGCEQSMSGTGDCYDNVPTESFWHRFKVKQVQGAGYSMREEAKQDVVAYIEGFYNGVRRHSALGYLSRREFLQRHLQQRDSSTRQNRTK